MTAQRLIFKKGEMIYFTSGAYSDFGVEGHFKVLKNVNLRKKAQEYFNGKDPYKECCYSLLIPNLVREGYIEDFDITPVYLGAYFEIDKDFGIKYKYKR